MIGIGHIGPRIGIDVGSPCCQVDVGQWSLNSLFSTISYTDVGHTGISIHVLINQSIDQSIN